MQQIKVDAYVDQNGVLSVKMPPSLAGMEIKGKLLYQVDSISLQKKPDKQVDIEVIRNICQEIRNLPTLDSKTPDEIIGYNQFGVPE